jgi:hypothetical protein
VAATLLTVAVTAAAQAQGRRVVVDRAPTMSGTARVGQSLSASGGHWSGPNGTRATWAWLRCSGNSPNSTISKSQSSQLNGCDVVRTDSSSYSLTNDDANRYIRLVLYAWYGSGRDAQYDFMATAPSARVATAPPVHPPPPAVTPVPTPVPAPTVAPTPVPTFDPPAASPVPTNGQILHNTQRRVIRPFPTVRMKGYLTSRGARVTRLTVHAPRHVRIKVRCSGHCPTRHWSKTPRKHRVTRLARFQHTLRAGTRISVTITRHGYIGKQTVFRIRRGKAPQRADRCVSSSGRRTSCPAGV